MSTHKILYIFVVINCHLGGHLVHILILFLFGYKLKCLQLDSNFIAINLRKKLGLRYFFPYHQIFSPIIGLHLRRHLGYIEKVNDARVASLGFLKDNVCTTRINNEKKFKIKFQVLLKFAQILPDYMGRKWKKNQRGITWKLNTGEQSFLHVTHSLYLIHIPRKFQEDIPNDYRVMGCTRMEITQNKQKQNKH